MQLGDIAGEIKNTCDDGFISFSDYQETQMRLASFNTDVSTQSSDMSSSAGNTLNTTETASVSTHFHPLTSLTSSNPNITQEADHSLQGTSTPGLTNNNTNDTHTTNYSLGESPTSPLMSTVNAQNTTQASSTVSLTASIENTTKTVDSSSNISSPSLTSSTQCSTQKINSELQNISQTTSSSLQRPSTLSGMGSTQNATQTTFLPPETNNDQNVTPAPPDRTRSRNISISNCNSVSSIPEAEARQLLLSMNKSFSDDLFVLQEGEVFLPDLRMMINYLQWQWAPLLNHRSRKRRRRHKSRRQTLNMEISTNIICDLNTNDDATYLVIKLEEKTNLWGKNLTDMDHLISVACYLAKISSVTTEETIDKTLAGRSRDTFIAQKMREIAASTSSLEVKVTNLKADTEKARSNVTEALNDNLDFVYVCVNAHKAVSDGTIQIITQVSNTASHKTSTSSMTDNIQNHTQAASVSMHGSFTPLSSVSTQSNTQETNAIHVPSAPSQEISQFWQTNSTDTFTQVTKVPSQASSPVLHTESTQTTAQTINVASQPSSETLQPDNTKNTTQITNLVSQESSQSFRTAGTENVTQTTNVLSQESSQILQTDSSKNMEQTTSFPSQESSQVLETASTQITTQTTIVPAHESSQALQTDSIESTTQTSNSGLQESSQIVWTDSTQNTMQTTSVASQSPYEILQTNSTQNTTQTTSIVPQESSQILHTDGTHTTAQSINIASQESSQILQTDSRYSTTKSTDIASQESSQILQTATTYNTTQSTDMESQESSQILQTDSTQSTTHSTNFASHESSKILQTDSTHSTTQTTGVASQDFSQGLETGSSHNTTQVTNASSQAASSHQWTNNRPTPSTTQTLDVSLQLSSTPLLMANTQNATHISSNSTQGSLTYLPQNFTQDATTGAFFPSQTTSLSSATGTTESTRHFVDISPSSTGNMQNVTQTLNVSTQVPPTHSVTNMTPNTTQNLNSLQNIYVSNCSSESFFPEKEAKGELLYLNKTLTDDISTLQVGKLFLEVMREMLIYLQGFWQPLDYQVRRVRKRRRRKIRVRGQNLSMGMGLGLSCDLNFNNDPKYLTDQLEEKINLWGKTLTDSETLFHVACYLTKIFSNTNNETIEKGLAGRSRDTEIAKKIGDIAASTLTIERKVNNIIAYTKEAVLNVTEALNNNSYFVYVCVNIPIPLQKDNNSTTQTPNTSSQGPSLVLPTTNITDNVTETSKPSHESFTYPVTSHTLDTTPTTKIPTLVSLTPISTNNTQNNIQEASILPPGFPTLLPTDSTQNDSQIASSSLQSSSLPNDNTQNSFPTGNFHNTTQESSQILQTDSINNTTQTTGVASQDFSQGLEADSSQNTTQVMNASSQEISSHQWTDDTPSTTQTLNVSLQLSSTPLLTSNTQNATHISNNSTQGSLTYLPQNSTQDTTTGAFFPSQTTSLSSTTVTTESTRHFVDISPSSTGNMQNVTQTLTVSTQVPPTHSVTNMTLNTTQNPSSLQNIYVSNCSSESFFPEKEAKELLLHLNKTLADDISTLQDGKLFLEDMREMLIYLQGLWQPLNYQVQRVRRRRRNIRERRQNLNMGMGLGLSCDLNANDDPEYLADQLEEKTNLWGETLTDSESLFHVTCYLTKISSNTNDETIEKGLAGRSRDAEIAKKIGDIAASTLTIERKVNNIIAYTKEAVLNVTEALNNNSYFVYVCVNIPIPLQNNNNITTQTPNTASQGPSLVLPATNITNNVTETNKPSHETFTHPMTSHTLNTTPTTKTPTLESLTPISTDSTQNNTLETSISPQGSPTLLPTDSTQNDSQIASTSLQSSSSPKDNTQNSLPTGNIHNTTQVATDPGPQRYISVSNCSLVSSLLEEEARQLLLHLNETYSNDISTLQEGETFLHDLRTILNNLQSFWEPLPSQRQSERKGAGGEKGVILRERRSSSPDCDINPNDDGGFLTDKLEETTHLWAEAMTDSDRLFTATCYLAKISTHTNVETVEKGSERTRDAVIAQKMRDIANSTSALEERADALKVQIEEARLNVTEALINNEDYVCVCVDI